MRVFWIAIIVTALSTEPAWAGAPPRECAGKPNKAAVSPKLSTEDVLSIARAKAKATGITDLSGFEPPQVCFDSESREWSVRFEGLSEKGVMMFDNWFLIRIDDATRAANYFGAA
jgi:hypothetical protein